MSVESKQIVLDSCKLQRKIGLLNSKVPVLVGKTSSGKTWWVQHELSQQLKLPIVKVLLQNEQPDEVLGYPKYLKEDTLTYLKPAWWTDEPSIFFFDELDKARDELHACILTLMREGTIRGRQLPSGSVIICAMNESDSLSEPLKARSIFVPFEYEQRESIFPDVLAYMQEVYTMQPTLPKQIPNMESVHFLEHYSRINPNILKERAVLRLLCSGLFPPKQVPSIMDMLTGNKDIEYNKIIEDDELFTNFIATISNPADVSKHFIEFVKIGSTRYQAKRLCKLLRKFATTNAEDFIKIYETNHDILMDNFPNLARHKFNIDFVRELGVEMHKLLNVFTDKVDDMYYNWTKDGEEFDERDKGIKEEEQV